MTQPKPYPPRIKYPDRPFPEANSRAYGEYLSLEEHDAIVAELERKLKVAEGALWRVIARSHTWIITPEIAHEAVIHGDYRQMATEALKEIRGEP